MQGGIAPSLQLSAELMERINAKAQAEAIWIRRAQRWTPSRAI
jgi:hypothetical protein